MSQVIVHQKARLGDRRIIRSDSKGCPEPRLGDPCLSTAFFIGAPAVLSHVLSPVVIGVVFGAILPVTVGEGMGSINPPVVQ